MIDPAFLDAALALTLADAEPRDGYSVARLANGTLYVEFTSRSRKIALRELCLLELFDQERLYRIKYPEMRSVQYLAQQAQALGYSPF